MRWPEPAGDGPLTGWSVWAGGGPAAHCAGRLLAALGTRPAAGPDLDGIVLQAPSGARAQLAGLGGDAATDWAVSGALWLTGHRSGPPLLPPGEAASLAGGALLAFGALATVAGRPVQLDGRRLLGERAALAGFGRRGPVSAGGGTHLLRAMDGVVALTLARDADREAVPALLGRERTGEPWAAIGRWASRQPAVQVADRAALLGIPAAALPEEAPVLPPYRLCRKGSRTETDVPLVVDLTALWAGPLAANLLGLTGARVVKVESRSRLDGARQGPRAFYDLMHAGHRSVLLDLQDRADLDRLRRLLTAADLVLEAARPRALRQLGIGPADTGGSWLAVRAYDAAGPHANRVGFGDDVTVGAGLAVRSPRGVILPVGDALADPVAGMCAAVAGLATLVGDGSWIVETSLAQALSPAGAFGAGLAARRSGRDWVIATPGGPLPVHRPWARPVPVRPAPPAGADTAAVFAELAC
jgi:crotonobetainyl-CoA:carnitine CoA-transferase CaiB-like acyl-CoA transferase